MKAIDVFSEMIEIYSEAWYRLDSKERDNIDNKLEDLKTKIVEDSATNCESTYGSIYNKIEILERKIDNLLMRAR